MGLWTAALCPDVLSATWGGMCCIVSKKSCTHSNSPHPTCGWGLHRRAAGVYSLRRGGIQRLHLMYRDDRQRPDSEFFLELEKTTHPVRTGGYDFTHAIR